MLQSRRKCHAIWRLMRPWHYGKNLLVFVPLFFSGQFFSAPHKAAAALTGFISMSLMASSVYVLNDLRDASHDRLHPVKCRRPIASGQITKREAVCLFGVLLLGAYASMAISCFVAERPLYALLLLTAYLLLNLAYSVLGMKNKPVLDVTIVAMGFIVRLLYGAALTGVRVSNWLLLTVLMGSYYMALGKRRNELRDARKNTREVLGRYVFSFLDKCMYMFLTLTIAFYALWSMDGQSATSNAHGCAVLSVPMVVVIAMCYCMDVEGSGDADPVEVLLHDKALIALVLAYVAMMLVIIYAGG